MTTSAMAPPAVAQAGPPPNIAVSSKVPSTDAYQQPSMAIDPTNPTRISIAYGEGTVLEACHLARSFDGGESWSTVALVGRDGRYPLRPESTRCWNPKVAYGSDGTLYYAIQDRWPNERTGGHALVYASGDGGASFRPPTAVDTVDVAEGTGWWPDLGTDPANGRVYVAWSRRQSMIPIPARVLVSSSTDRGATFSEPVFVSPPNQAITSGPLVAVGPDGALYVSYLDHTKWFGSRAEQPAELYVAASDDAGRSFRSSGVIDRVAPGCVLATAGPFNCDRFHGNGPWQINAIAAGRTAGQVFTAWWDARGPDGRARVSFSSSSDAATTWSPPRVLDLSPGPEDHDQVRPWLSVAPNGRLDLVYYSVAPDGTRQVYRVSSEDDGRSFSRPTRLSNGASEPGVGPPSFFPTAGDEIRWGDYLAVASTNTATLAAWTDNRRGCFDSGHQDIVFASLAIGAPTRAARPASGAGYWLVGAQGEVLDYGDATFCGAARTTNQPIVAIAATPTRRGYWLASGDGRIQAFGDAAPPGGADLRLNQPIVGMAANPAGKGYWLVASDGGVFAFGDAPYRGSTGAVRLNRPIVDMAPTPSGKGYWLVASDGGVFAFGDAPYRGSTGAVRLNRPIVGMAPTPSGKGYWLVASDGGVFAFGDAAFLGSTGAMRLNRPIVAIGTSPTGGGYWLAADDGGTFAFGDAPFLGAAVLPTLSSPVIGIASR